MLLIYIFGDSKYDHVNITQNCRKCKLQLRKNIENNGKIKSKKKIKATMHKKFLLFKDLNAE